MRNLIIGVSLLALAGAAVAQVTPVPDAAAIVPTPLDAAAAQRAADAEKAAAKDRAAAEERMNDQAKQAEKDRAAAEKSAREQEKAAEKQQAAADKAAADMAAAEKAGAATAAAAPKGDARDVATQVCLAEAKSRATALGATNVTMNEVKDTDKKSDGRAGITAKVNVVTTDSKGKVKVQKKTIKCETRNGTVTKFKWD